MPFAIVARFAGPSCACLRSWMSSQAITRVAKALQLISGTAKAFLIATTNIRRRTPYAGLNLERFASGRGHSPFLNEFWKVVRVDRCVPTPAG